MVRLSKNVFTHVLVRHQLKLFGAATHYMYDFKIKSNIFVVDFGSLS